MTNRTTDDISSLAADIASRYTTDTIVILGKGPSAEEVHSRVFEGNLTIGINDAERIHPMDISIFYEDWVAESVQAEGMRSQAYVTSTDLMAPGRRIVKLPFQPLSNDEEDLILLRFQNREEIAIEEAIFLTALEVARTVAESKGRTQTVYMVGFDFTPASGHAKSATTTFAPDLDSRRAAGIAMQEYVLRNALYTLEDSELSVHHVGTKDFSSLGPKELNEQHNVSVTAPAQPTVRAAAPETRGVEVTAEITTNHFGDFDRLEKLVRAAHEAGADWVKVQKRDVASFYTREQLAQPYRSPFGSTFGEYRNQLELDHEGFRFLDDLCADLGIGWFASVLDQPSFEFMLDLNVPMIKLPSTISEHKQYLSHVAQRYTGSLVLSTGMTDHRYEEWVLETFKKQDKLYLLHCNSAYPTPDEHTNVGVVRHYTELAKEHPQIVPGYSSHDFGWMASALAVAAGARMVEKHVKLGNTEWAHFDAVAVDLNSDDFTEYVAAIRKAEVLVGSTQKQITDSEHHKYQVPSSR
ncbi:N-acetylneuraminate synthase family protein [Nesterenkonia halotolerans]|uniref:N-acetylneuraminate synthase n=1 Tax=Nesterenkonia halotolerans TaxID=225325 RepID=A0ABR9J9U4_9MICC|nr:N-acetylneuraminate synthase family protein [Nesterenkonia halotolerans]MBE1515761.1 N-acetylneuraminate synthase [Nesterenkonia halotolerans]